MYIVFYKIENLDLRFKIKFLDDSFWWEYKCMLGQLLVLVFDLGLSYLWVYFLYNFKKSLVNIICMFLLVCYKRLLKYV